MNRPLDDLCPYLRELPALVQGELQEPLATDVARHVPSCADCSAELASLEALLKDLGSLGKEASDDAPRSAHRRVARILESLSQVDWSKPANLGRVVTGMAAAAAIIAVLTFPPERPKAPEIVRPRAVDRAAMVERAAEWLAANQEDDGSWSAGRHGGLAAHDLGVTGLALLALSRRDPAEAVRTSLDRGVTWVLRQQQPDGKWGRGAGSGSVAQGLITLALVTLQRQHSWPDLIPPIQRALDRICRRQSTRGGWDYDNGGESEPDLISSAWNFESLVLAQHLGLGEYGKAIGIAEQWMATLRDSKGRYGYRKSGIAPYGHETLSLLGARLSALTTSPETGFFIKSRPDDLLGFYCHAHLDTSVVPWIAAKFAGWQASAGSLSGSVSIRADRFGGEGGRVYTTAMCILALSNSSR